MVLRRFEGQDRLAVAEGDEADLFTGQELFEDPAGTGGPAPPDPAEPPDWIEPSTPGPGAVSLDGLSITNDSTEPLKFRVPAGITLPAGALLTFLADDDRGQNSLPARQAWHMNFQLDNENDSLGVYGGEVPALEPGKMVPGFVLTSLMPEGENIRIPNLLPKSVLVSNEFAIERPLRLPGKARLDGELGRQGVEQARLSLGDAMHETARGLLRSWFAWLKACLLYTSDAADERSSVDLGGRRIIKKKKKYR